MKKSIKRIPLPLSGVMLGTAALGNLLQSYSEGLRLFCGGLAGILFLMLVLKLIFYPGLMKEDMKNPIMASVAGTFPMALMLLSTYLKPFIGQGAFIVWTVAVFLHIALILYFTTAFLLPIQMPKIFASCFIVYVGIVTASITAPVYKMQKTGAAAFWFGLTAVTVLLVIITIRYVKYREIPDPAKPLICIYAAPVSLCTAGYIQSVPLKSNGLLITMFAVSCILYLLSLINAIRFLKLPFFPSCASFTFPFVISAIASKQTTAYLADMGHPLPALQLLVLIETIIAVVMVLYTLIRFTRFILQRQPEAV